MEYRNAHRQQAPSEQAHPESGIERRRGILNAPDGRNTYDGDASEDRRSQDRNSAPRDFDQSRDFGHGKQDGRYFGSAEDGGRSINYGEHYGQSAYGKVRYSRESLDNWRDPREELGPSYFTNREQDYRGGGWNQASHDCRQPSGVAWESDRASREGSHAGKGPKNYRRSDERIHEEVCDRLAQHSEIDASEVEVAVRNGEVTLSGSVSDKRMKRLAEDISDSIAGVTEVMNQIRVSRGESGVANSKPSENGSSTSRSSTSTPSRNGK